MHALHHPSHKKAYWQREFREEQTPNGHQRRFSVEARANLILLIEKTLDPEGLFDWERPL